MSDSSGYFCDKFNAVATAPFRAIRTIWNLATGRTWIAKCAPDLADETLKADSDPMGGDMNPHFAYQLWTGMITGLASGISFSSVEAGIIGAAAGGLTVGWLHAAYTVSRQHKMDDARQKKPTPPLAP